VMIRQLLLPSLHQNAELVRPGHQKQFLASGTPVPLYAIRSRIG
jgi:hypothetical protein